MLEIFLREGHFERHLNRMRSVYRAKHDLLIRCLREMSDILELYGENAGLHVRVRFKNGMTEEEALRRAAGEKIRVYGPWRVCHLNKMHPWTGTRFCWATAP